MHIVFKHTGNDIEGMQLYRPYYNDKAISMNTYNHPKDASLKDFQCFFNYIYGLEDMLNLGNNDSKLTRLTYEFEGKSYAARRPQIAQNTIQK